MMTSVSSAARMRRSGAAAAALAAVRTRHTGPARILAAAAAAASSSRSQPQATCAVCCPHHYHHYPAIGVRHSSTSAASSSAATATAASASSSSSSPVPPSATLLDGLATSRTILRDLGTSVARLRASRQTTDPSAPLLRPPGLAVILATRSRDSQRYVERKADAAKQVGFKSITRHFDEHTVTEQQILDEVKRLNADPSIDGILVQLPLPPHVSQARILAAVAPIKDVDCFHPANVGALALFAARDGAHDADSSVGPQAGPLALSGVKYSPWERRLAKAATTVAPAKSAAAAPTAPPTKASLPAALEQDASLRVEDPFPVYHVPCTPKACLELLDRYDIPLRGKHVVVLGRSASVGLPLTLLLLSRCATVSNVDQTMPHEVARSLCRQADVLVAAAGVPEYLTSEWVKPGAAVVDVGINFVPRVSTNTQASTTHGGRAPENPLDTAAGVRLVGDVHFASVQQVAGFVSPVPGGVGPMTVAMLMDNTFRSYIRALELQRELDDTTNDDEHAAATTAPPASVTDAALAAPLTSPPAPMLFFSGGPGAGKGTQCSRLVSQFGLRSVRGCDGNDAPVALAPNHAPLQFAGCKYGVVHISCGALLRQQMTNPSPDLPASTRDEIQSVLQKGGILRGAVTVALLRAEVARVIREAAASAEPDVLPVFVIDGFPRSIDNLTQFEENFCPLESILELECDDDTMRARLLLRARSDDKPDVITRRLRGFKEETQPAIRHWRSQKQGDDVDTAAHSAPATAAPKVHDHFTVDGRPSIDEVYTHVRAIFLQFLQRSTRK